MVHVNTAAKVVLVGITLGMTQLVNSATELQRLLLAGRDRDSALRAAKATGAFSCAMRSNLIRLLDAIGLNAVAVVFQAGTKKQPRRLPKPVAAPVGVPEQAGDVSGLALIKVDNLDLMQIWNELMLSEHPQGARPLVGAQMRYLIGSNHG